MQIEHRVSRPLAALLALWLAGEPVAGVLSTAWAQPADCGAAIEDARASYFEGRFDQAVARLDDCLRTDSIPLADRPQAYRILALCHIAKDETSDARTAVHQLLLLRPDWQTDPLEDPPAFQDLVIEVEREMRAGRLVSSGEAGQAGKNGGKKWWILGSLAAAGGAIAVVLLSGGRDEVEPDADLPAPPDLPER
jgi:hypothetical protein